MSAVVAGRTTFTHGLSVSMAATRTATLTDTNNLGSLSTLIQTMAINGRTYNSTYTTADRTFTETTPENRSTMTTIDAQGRPVLEQVNGSLPISRPTTVTAG